MHIAAVTFLVLFLFCTVTRALVNEYKPLDELNACQKCPQLCEEAKAANTTSCACDASCTRYGDCCYTAPNCPADSPAPELPGLQCLMIRPGSDEAYWMVTECSVDWLDGQTRDGRLVNEMCLNGSNTLPPVTDRNNGVAYKNEYCAVCNQVTNILPWLYQFECPDCAGESIKLIKTSCPYRLLHILEIIEADCVACGFSVPSSGPAARPCLPDSLLNSKCLTRNELETVTCISWKMKEYMSMATQCYSGPVQPVALCQDIIFKNQYCAICNGHLPYCLSCPQSSALNIQQGSKGCQVPDLECSIRIGNECSDFTLNRTSRYVQSPPKFNNHMWQHSREPRNIRERNSCEIFCENICNTSEIPTSLSSFIVTLDVIGDFLSISSHVISTTNITVACPRGEIFNPFTQSCRHTICPEGFAAIKGSCSTLMIVTDSYKSSNINHSSHILCEGYLITLNISEFEIIRNNSVLFGGKIYNILGYDNDLPLICTNLSENGTIVQNTTMNGSSHYLRWVVLIYVGCTLSVIGCTIVLLTYTLFKEMRTLPGMLLMNVAAVILANCLLFMIGFPVASVADIDGLCEAAAIFLHWLVLSQFFWMSVMSFDLLRIMYRSSKCRPMQKGAIVKKIFSLYLFIGWGIPLMITIISVILNYTTSAIGYGINRFCWINNIPSLFLVFLMPVVFTLLFNAITFTFTLVFLFKASWNQARLKKQNSISYLRLSLCVFSVTGLTWMFGFVAILVDDDWAWYLFIILTSTQGLVICVAFIFTKKVGRLYKEKLSKLMGHSISFMSSSRQRNLSGSKQTAKNSNQDETNIGRPNELTLSTQLTMSQVESANEEQVERNMIEEQHEKEPSTT